MIFSDVLVNLRLSLSQEIKPDQVSGDFIHSSFCVYVPS